MNLALDKTLALEMKWTNLWNKLRHSTRRLRELKKGNEEINQAKLKLMEMLAATKVELAAYRNQNAGWLLWIEQAKQRKLKMVEMARRHNMSVESRPVGNGEDNGQMLWWMPLERHCELFAWLPLHCQLRLVPALCRGIWVVQRRDVRRKLESLNKWHQWDLLRIAMSNDGRTVKRINKSFGYGTLRAKNPFPSQIPKCGMRRIYYFEVTFVNNPDDKGYCIEIGLCDANFPLKEKWVGQIAHSFGIEGDNSDGYTYLH